MLQQKLVLRGTKPPDLLERISSVLGNSSQSNSRKKRELASSFDWEDIIYTPCIYRCQLVTDSNGNRKVVRYLPRGEILGKPADPLPGGRYNTWIYSRKDIGVKSPTRRIKVLHHFLNVLIEKGLPSCSVRKACKRLWKIAFTCHLNTLRKIVCSVTRKCNFRYDSTRNKPEVLTVREGPCFTQETKSVLKHGVTLPLWKWKIVRTQSNPTFK